MVTRSGDGELHRKQVAARVRMTSREPQRIQTWTVGEAQQAHGDAALLLSLHEQELAALDVRVGRGEEAARDLASDLAGERHVRAQGELSLGKDLLEARRIIGQEIRSRMELERRLRRQLFLLWTAAGLGGVLVAVAWCLR